MFSYYIDNLFENGKIKILLTLIITSITTHFSNLQTTAQSLIVLLLIDLFLGITIAFIKRNIRSKRIYEGLAKFVIYCFVYYTMYYLDKIIFHQEVSFGFANAALVYLGLTEAISILENISTLCKLMNWTNPIPRKLLDRFYTTREGIFDQVKTFTDNLSSPSGDKDKQKSNRMEEDKEEI